MAFLDRKRTSYLLLVSAAALFAWAIVARPSAAPAPTPMPPDPPRPPVQQGQRPQVDVVFALDTTGSMSGLLEGAKKKIWEIARFIAQGQPTPQLRIGLVAYRDIGDDYVTKVYDLTDDLDAVYQNLSSFTAAGGGDTPEHVAKALYDAVYRVSWTPGKNTLRIIYLVGDAPPHTDYNDGYNYHAVAQQAGERGIRINTIRCGGDPDTQVAWTEIAQRAKGEYSTIDQSGGVVDVNTPYDDDLAALNRRLLGTAMGWGSAAKKEAVRSRAEGALAAPKAVQAERAGLFGLFRTKGGKAAAVSGDDLLSAVEDKKADLRTLPKEDLPEAMQTLSPEDRQRYVEEKSRERKDVLDQINAVSAKRDAYLRSAKPAAPGGFDGKVRESLKKQAASIGIKY